jgi:hypothetical protein
MNLRHISEVKTIQLYSKIRVLWQTTWQRTNDTRYERQEIGQGILQIQQFHNEQSWNVLTIPEIKKTNQHQHYANMPRAN